jgi:hypothetical protein
MESTNQYQLYASGTAPMLFPTDTMFALLLYGSDDALQIPKRYPYAGEWGQPLSTHLLDRDQYPVPGLLDMVWLSVVERKFYTLTRRLSVDKMTHHLDKKSDDGLQMLEHIIVGMAPYGGVALWLHGHLKSVIVDWMHAEQTEVAIEDFLPQNPDTTLKQVCDFYINSAPLVRENLERNGLPPRDLFDNYMKQFSYRYQVVFGLWDEEKEEWLSDEKVKQAEEAGSVMPELDYIEEALYDGTHDKLHDGGLMNYHEAGKPKKLAIKWHIKKSEYSAYFWFEDEEIRAVYDRFYGAHPDTKTDFMIRIDSEKNKYELALYRYGLKEPQVISEPVYQLIVFKNKFECFRSENYNQERGAWIW